MGGPPGTFSVISPGADRIQWGGGSSVAEVFPVVTEFFPVNKSITFPRFRDILATFSGHRTLTEIQGHFPRLLTNSNHVTKLIHSGKKHLTKVWGSHGPLAPPGYATVAKGLHKKMAMHFNIWKKSFNFKLLSDACIVCKGFGTWTRVYEC